MSVRLRDGGEELPQGRAGAEGLGQALQTLGRAEWLGYSLAWQG